MKVKILSGGQTGADRAGLDVAIAYGYEHGGFCPKGRLSEEGPIPEYYNLVETEESSYRKRTLLNIKKSDVTLLFTISTKLTPGSRLTLTLCANEQKPCHWITIDGAPMKTKVNEIIEFLAKHSPKIINIAGSRESKAPGIYSATYTILEEVLKVYGI